MMEGAVKFYRDFDSHRKDVKALVLNATAKFPRLGLNNEALEHSHRSAGDKCRRNSRHSYTRRKNAR